MKLLWDIKTIYTRNLIFENITIDNISIPLIFYYINNPQLNNIVYNGISFAMNPRNQSFSLMHLLYKQNLIEHIIYAIELVDNGGGNFYIGGISDRAIKTKRKGECNVKEKTWGCQLTEVFFSSDTSYEIKSSFVNKKKYRAIFQAGYKNIYAPKEFIDFINDKVFGDYIKSGLCFYTHSSFFNCMSIKCYNDTIIQLIPKYINFAFDNNVYRVKMEELFHYYKEDGLGLVVYFDIVENLENEKDLWIFGTVFLKHFTSVFDYENKKIMMYSENDVLHYDNKFKDENDIYILIAKILFVILVIELIINISSLFDSHSVDNTI